MSLRRSHLPGLDGLRALAVTSVVVYHLNWGWIHGGFLGVDLFFVLSGFLITTLLLEEKLETGRLALVQFWRRRARRLLPALFLMISVVVSFPLLISLAGHADAVATLDIGFLRGSGLSSFFYYANWFVIGSGHSYFAGIAAPSPLAHTWSLAIEEQFYLVWPLLTYWLMRRGVNESRRFGVTVSASIAVVSSVLMAWIFSPSSSSSANFVYNASFTRLFDLAAGATLAWFVVQRPTVKQHRRWSDPLGAIGLIGLCAAFYFAGDGGGVPTNFMFEGGFLLCALLAVALIAAVRVEESLFARLFSLTPLRAVGKVSYGVYLWHWPVIIFVTAGSTGLGGKKLFLLRIVLIVAATIASYFLIEKPIREQRWPLWPRRIVASLASVITLVLIVLMTAPTLFPVPDLTSELAAYAPSVPPTGSGGVIGTLDHTWVGSGGFTPRNPMHVLVLGDSIPYFSAAGLSAALDAMPSVKSMVTSFPTFGLRDHKFWGLFLGSVTTFHPQVVIFINHADEPYAKTNPVQYQADVLAFAHVVTGDGVRNIIFATVPRQHTPFDESFTAQREAFYENGFHQENLAWRHAVIAVVHGLPGVAAYFPVHQSLEVHGAYETWIAPPRNPGAPRRTWARVRMTDGIHMCAIGTEVYAGALTYDLATSLGIAQAHPGWWRGSWPYTGRSFRSNVALWCPNDHPGS